LASEVVVETKLGVGEMEDEDGVELEDGSSFEVREDENPEVEKVEVEVEVELVTGGVEDVDTGATDELVEVEVVRLVGGDEEGVELVDPSVLEVEEVVVENVPFPELPPVCRLANSTRLVARAVFSLCRTSNAALSSE